MRIATHSGFLTPDLDDEVAGILQIGGRTAYELACTGRLGGASTIGGSWRILDQDELGTWARRGGEAGEAANANMQGAQR